MEKLLSTWFRTPYILLLFRKARTDRCAHSTYREIQLWETKRRSGSRVWGGRPGQSVGALGTHCLRSPWQEAPWRGRFELASGHMGPVVPRPSPATLQDFSSFFLSCSAPGAQGRCHPVTLRPCLSRIMVGGDVTAHIRWPASTPPTCMAAFTLSLCGGTRLPVWALALLSPQCGVSSGYCMSVPVLESQVPPGRWRWLGFRRQESLSR